MPTVEFKFDIGDAVVLPDKFEESTGEIKMQINESRGIYYRVSIDGETYCRQIREEQLKRAKRSILLYYDGDKFHSVKEYDNTPPPLSALCDRTVGEGIYKLKYEMRGILYTGHFALEKVCEVNT